MTHRTAPDQARAPDRSVETARSEARRLRHLLAVVFLGLGGWALLFPGMVLSLGLRPEFQGGDPVRAIVMGCFGAQAVLCGTVILTARFTSTTFLVFGLVGSLPFFAFNWYFVVMWPVFTPWMLLDIIGNVAILVLCLKGWATLRRAGSDTA